MAKRRAKSRKAQVQHTHLAIKVESYEVSSDVSVNFNLRTFPLHFADDDDPVLEYVTALDISGVCIAPEARAGDAYEISIRGDEGRRSEKLLTLKDLQDRDEDRVPIYKTYRGENYPVYRDIPGIATLNKTRGENRWDAWIQVAPRLVSDMLALLPTGRPLYLAIHERKLDRKRWIESISLQTTDPAEE